MKKIISVLSAVCVSFSVTAQVFLTANALSPYYESFSYQSADELSEALEAGFSDDVIAEIEGKETDSNKGAFRSFLNAVDECGLYVPVFDGEQLPYRSISIQTHDIYKNPNIYYSYEVNESDVSYISIMYLDPKIKDSANTNGVEWLKNQINPNGIDSEIQYPGYDLSDTLNIQLADRSIPVLLGNFENDSRDFLEFVYDDVFVRFVCKTNIWDSESLIKDFSFNKIPLTAAEKITDHDVIIQMLSEYIKEQGLPVRILWEEENITEWVVLEYYYKNIEVPTLIEDFMAENNIDENEVKFSVAEISSNDTAEKITDHDVIIQMLSDFIKEQGLPVRIVGEDKNITEGVVLEYSAPDIEIPTIIEKFIAENNIDEKEITFRILDIAYDNVRGDVNADGVFSVADVVLLQKWLLSSTDSKLVNWKAADLCEDGRLDVFDLCLMKQALVDTPNESPTEPTDYGFHIYEEYLKFIYDNDLQDKLVTYDQISFFGEFVQFFINADWDYNNYFSIFYILDDGSGKTFDLIINDLDHIKPDNRVYEKLSDEQIILYDMREADTEAEYAYYAINEKRYNYHDGKLLSIVWYDGEYEYMLIGNPMLSEYPHIDNTYLSELLNLTAVSL